MSAPRRAHNIVVLLLTASLYARGWQKVLAQTRAHSLYAPYIVAPPQNQVIRPNKSKFSAGACTTIRRAREEDNYHRGVLYRRKFLSYKNFAAAVQIHVFALSSLTRALVLDTLQVLRKV